MSVTATSAKILFYFHSFKVHLIVGLNQLSHNDMACTKRDKM